MWVTTDDDAAHYPPNEYRGEPFTRAPVPLAGGWRRVRARLPAGAFGARGMVGLQLRLSGAVGTAWIDDVVVHANRTTTSAA